MFHKTFKSKKGNKKGQKEKRKKEKGDPVKPSRLGHISLDQEFMGSNPAVAKLSYILPNTVIKHEQQYHVVLLGTGWVGLKWQYGDGQAGPCMGRCIITKVVKLIYYRMGSFWSSFKFRYLFTKIISLARI